MAIKEYTKELAKEIKELEAGIKAAKTSIALAEKAMVNDKASLSLKRGELRVLKMAEALRRSGL